MLWTMFVVLLILWALGMVSSYTIGGFIHILLVDRAGRGADPRDPGPATRVGTRAPQWTKVLRPLACRTP